LLSKLIAILVHVVGVTISASAPTVAAPIGYAALPDYTWRQFLLSLRMNLTDAMIVLLLAAQIHGTDEGVRAAAKSIVKKLPRSKRDGLYKVIDSRNPLLMVGLIAENLDV
jgi:hypothetical protein